MQTNEVLEKIMEVQSTANQAVASAQAADLKASTALDAIKGHVDKCDARQNKIFWLLVSTLGVFVLDKLGWIPMS